MHQIPNNLSTFLSLFIGKLHILKRLALTHGITTPQEMALTLFDRLQFDSYINWLQPTVI